MCSGVVRPRTRVHARVLRRPKLGPQKARCGCEPISRPRGSGRPQVRASRKREPLTRLYDPAAQGFTAWSRFLMVAAQNDNRTGGAVTKWKLLKRNGQCQAPPHGLCGRPLRYRRAHPARGGYRFDGTRGLTAPCPHPISATGVRTASFCLTLGPPARGQSPPREAGGGAFRRLCVLSARRRLQSGSHAQLRAQGKGNHRPDARVRPRA